MSLWEDYDFERRIQGILADVQSHDPGHHFGRPFLLSYQLAIEFRRRYPGDFDRIGKPVGGKGTKQHDSLSQYIARELSQRISNRSLQDGNIEGRSLSQRHLVELTFNGEGQRIESSVTTANAVAMFRLCD